MGLLVLGKSDRLADPGVVGELRLIWLKDVAVLEEEEGVVGRVSFGRSAGGGRGAGPGFMNWSEAYMLK